MQRREPWPYLQRQGEQITTRNYIILTTAQDRPVARELPAFLEASLARHRTFAGSTIRGPALPGPPGRMQVFMFADRDEWAGFTRATIDDSAHPLLAIEVGGYASGGRAFLFALEPPRNDLTLKIAAHEGWHQYVQRSFRDPLPTWADEMIAVMAEGFVVNDAGKYVFEPLANPERWSQLRAIAQADRWQPLEDLLTGNPTDLLGESPMRAVDYYAQLWALGLYMATDQNRWTGIERLLRDAAYGRLLRELGRPEGARLGPLAFRRYVSSNIHAFDADYRAFASALVDESSANSRSGSTPR